MNRDHLRFTVAEPLGASGDVVDREFAEDLLHAAPCQARTDVVVLGEGGGVERLVVGLRREFEQCLARETGADAR
ncbi:hypothetical protein D3C78_1717180 [compost metagenome]